MAPKIVASFDHASIATAVEQVGRSLGEAFRATLEGIPGGPFRPQEWARHLGIKKDLSHRVVRASASHDPISVVHLMPGPAPLREFLAAAAGLIGPDVLRRAEAAVREFERLIQDRAGDRTSLDAIIGGWMPEAREKFETFNKQAVFRGMSQLKGALADVAVNTAILYPSADGSAIDGVWLVGFIGLRRIRPGASVHFLSGRFGPGTESLTLAGGRAEGLDGLLLEKFCTSPLPLLHAQQHGMVMHYSLADAAVGPGSAVNLLLAELTPRCMKRYRDGTRHRYGPSAEVSTPSRMLLLDVLLHKDVYPGSVPEAIVIDTAVNGVARLNDQSRLIDRLDLVQDVRFLEEGLEGLRVLAVPNYVEMVHHVMERLGWPMDEFRGFRCKAQYPVYGSQTFLAFEAPERPPG